MEGGWFPKCGSCFRAARTRLNKLADTSQMEGGWFPNYDSRSSATHIRFKHLQVFHGWREADVQNVALAVAPRTLVSKVCKSFTDGWRTFWLSPERCAH
eukprot:3042546-Pyramimonas_sp.AAC.2